MLRAFLSALSLASAAFSQGGSAIGVLGDFTGPRQHGLGGAGVAVPDAAQGMNFNPALAGLAFPRDRKTLLAANSWSNIVGPDWGFRDTDAPLLLENGPESRFFTGYPGYYHPGIGYIGLDRHDLHVDWLPDFDEYYYALTLATAPDFLETLGRRRNASWDWTVGVTVKWYASEAWPNAPTDGLALDIGGAWIFPRIPFLPGVEAVAGAALINLGPAVGEFPETDPLPEQYRLGYSLAWKPFRPLPGKTRELHPLVILATQEFRREFHNREADGSARAFPSSLFHDLLRRPGKTWEERYTHMGLEATAIDMVSARVGRHKVGYFREDRGEGVFWAYGYGVSTGPVLGRLRLRYDFARFFRTVSLEHMTPATLRQKSIQAMLTW